MLRDDTITHWNPVMGLSLFHSQGDVYYMDSGSQECVLFVCNVSLLESQDAPLSHLNEIDDWTGHSHTWYQELALPVQCLPWARDIHRRYIISTSITIF